jgi:hypothetical protein
MSRIEAIYVATALLVKRHCERKGIKPTLEMVENLVKQHETYGTAHTAKETAS